MEVFMFSFSNFIKNSLGRTKNKTFIVCLFAVVQVSFCGFQVNQEKSYKNFIFEKFQISANLYNQLKTVLAHLLQTKNISILKNTIPHIDSKTNLASRGTHHVSRAHHKQSNFDDNQTAALVEQIRRGIISGNELSAHKLYTICNYLKSNNLFRDKHDVRLSQELGRAFRKITAGNQFFQNALARYGSKPANTHTKNLIHDILRKQGCPEDMLPPVYQLNPQNMAKNEYIAGVTGAYCIWIDEAGLAHDRIDFEHTCAHEAGHWFYQHGIQNNFCTNNTCERHEYEADEFAFLSVRDEVRKTMLARARYVMQSQDYINNPNYIALLKPKITQLGWQTTHNLSLPTLEHSKNIVTIAQHYPHLA
jgi:hypothetical protein